MEKLNKIFETNRLILRPFKEKDAEYMFKNWASDERVTKYLTWLPYSSIENTKIKCKKWEEESKREDDYQFAIVLKEINEPIGSIGIIKLDKTNKTAEVGYCIGYNWWGKGIVVEALNELMNNIKKLDIIKFYAEVDSNNINSCKVLEKCGFKKENILKKDYNNKGEPINLVVYDYINN